MKRAAIQLPVNFLVTIIISIFLLVLGVLLINKFLSGAEEIEGQIDQQTNAEISKLLDQGQMVAIPFNIKTLPRDSRHIFGIGILNIYDNANFQVEVKPMNAYGKDDVPLPAQNIDNAASWTRYDSQPFNLARNQQESISLMVYVPKNATSGTYVFGVNVSIDGRQYDMPKRLYVKVS